MLTSGGTGGSDGTGAASGSPGCCAARGSRRLGGMCPPTFWVESIRFGSIHLQTAVTRMILERQLEHSMVGLLLPRSW